MSKTSISEFKYLLFCLAQIIGYTIGKLLVNKSASGFTTNTLLIPKQDLLMVYLSYGNKQKHLHPPSLGNKNIYTSVKTTPILQR